MDVLPNLLDDLLKAWDAKAVDGTNEKPQPEGEYKAAEEPPELELPIVTVTAAAPAPPPFDPVIMADPLFSDAEAETEREAGPPAEDAVEEVPADEQEEEEGAKQEYVPLAEATPMDALLSSLLASFTEPPPDETGPEVEIIAEAAVEPEPEQQEEVLAPEFEAELEPLAAVAAEFPLPAPPPPPPPPPAPPVRERETLGPIAIPQPAPSQMRKFVAVGFGRHKLAFPIDSVIEAGRYPRTTFVPGLPHYIRGVFAFRGSVLPVVDTRQLTGAPERFQPNDCRVLTVQSGTAKAAFVFDTLEGIVNFDPGALDTGAAPGYPLAGLLAGTNKTTSETYGVVDATRLLDLAGCLKESV